MTGRSQRRLAAIVAADVAGYSRLIGADEEGTLRALRAHRTELIDPLLIEHGGRVANTAGDSLLLEFPSVVDAVRCSITLQQGMSERNRNVADDRRIAFRIGINVGDVIAEGNDLLGDGVNIAARLEALCEPGGVTLSDDAYRQVRDRLDLNWQDCGEQTVKNIARSVQVWRWVAGEPVAPRPAGIGRPSSASTRPSIAVLPFRNLSGDPTQDYFVNGLVEDFTVALGREKWLLVVACPPASGTGDRPHQPGEIGRQLGVNYVLQGSVRRDAGRVRMVVQLSDGTSGGHVWSEGFEDDIDNVFAMQNRLMTQIVAAIGPALRSSEIERAYQKPTGSLSAFDLYLQALPRFRASLADNEAALKLLDEAIAFDPAYSSAFGLAARCYQFQKIMGWVPVDDPRLKLGSQFAQRAADLGKNDSEALWMAGTALVILDGELDQGPALIERSLSLNPSSANAWSSSCLIHSFLGNYENAIDHFYRSQRLNPLDQLHHLHWNMVGFAFFGAGRYGEADKAADNTLAVLPNYPPGLRLKLATCGQLGLTEESGKYLQRLLAVHPDCSLAWMNAFLEPLLRRNPGCLERFIEGARIAGLPKEPLAQA